MAARGRSLESCEECMAKLRDVCEAIANHGHLDEPTTTPEDTLREAGISDKRQARYQRRLSSLLAGRQ